MGAKKLKKEGFVLMKKMALCLAVMMLAATFAGCGSDGSEKGSSSSSSSQSSSSPASSSSSESSVSSEISEPDEADDEPVEIMIKDEKLKAAYTALREEFGEFWLSMPAVITEAQMTEIYYVNEEDVEEFVGEMSIANISGDTFVGAKAKPGKAETVAQALEKRRQDIITQFETYPVNFMDLKSQAAKVITEGDYVFLILMGDLNVPDGEDASMQMAEAEIARAEKAIRSAFEE